MRVKRPASTAPRLALGALGTVLFAVGCSSSSPASSGFPSRPLETLQSDHKSLQLQVWTSPGQPPAQGTLSVKLVIADAKTGAPVDGLTLSIVPEMPSMGHGTSLVPVVSDQGSGTYVVTDVDLFMAGQWDLDITVTGPVSDSATVPIEVQ